MRLLSIVVLSFLFTNVNAEVIDFWGGNKKYSYSATRVLHQDRRDPVVMKEYISPGKARLEMYSPDRKSITSILLILQENQQYISLVPESKMAMNMSSFAQVSGLGVNAKYDVLENKTVGTNKIAGYSTTKYRMKTRALNGEINEVYVWKTKHDIVIRMETIDKKKKWVMELKNLKLAKQNANLFVVPSDYNFVAGIGGLLQGAFGGAKSRSDEEFNDDMHQAGQDAVKAGVQDAIEEDASRAIERDVKKNIKKLFKW